MADDDAAGRFLHNLLGGNDQPGPPYTHTWRPSIPVPFYGLLHVRCDCGKRFWGLHDRAEPRYRRHYEQAHTHSYTLRDGYADPNPQ